MCVRSHRVRVCFSGAREEARAALTKGMSSCTKAKALHHSPQSFSTDGGRLRSCSVLPSHSKAASRFQLDMQYRPWQVLVLSSRPCVRMPASTRSTAEAGADGGSGGVGDGEGGEGGEGGGEGGGGSATCPSGVSSQLSSDRTLHAHARVPRAESPVRRRMPMVGASRHEPRSLWSSDESSCACRTMISVDGLLPA